MIGLHPRLGQFLALTFKIVSMSHFLEQAGLFDKVIRLDAEEQADPFLVFDRFFNDYRLHEWRHNLWTMSEVCLTTDNPQFASAEERANLLLRYQDLEKLLEAAFLALQQYNAETTSRNTPSQ
jgi:hypothetical protein